MVAMLVPKKFIKCIVYKEEKIDVGATMFNTLVEFDNLDDDDLAAELGGASFALSDEMRLARNEHVIRHPPSGCSSNSGADRA